MWQNKNAYQHFSFLFCLPVLKIIAGRLQVTNHRSSGTVNGPSLTIDYRDRYPCRERFHLNFNVWAFQPASLSIYSLLLRLLRNDAENQKTTSPP